MFSAAALAGSREGLKIVVELSMLYLASLFCLPVHCQSSGNTTLCFQIFPRQYVSNWGTARVGLIVRFYFMLATSMRKYIPKTDESCLAVTFNVVPFLFFYIVLVYLISH